MALIEPLTDRQSEILKLIRDLTESSGFPPTRAEIAQKMGFRSVNAAEQHLRALERKGALDILQGASRGLRVRDKAPARVALPNFQALMAQGVYFRQNYTVQTADPSNRFPPTPWAENGYTSSIPNVVQMSGTAMILPGKQKYVQDSFFPLKITVHAVNEISYRSLDGSFHYTAQAGGSGMRAAGYKVGND